MCCSPQPFKTTEVVAGGHSKPSDRIFVDGTGFLANVVVEVYSAFHSYAPSDCMRVIFPAFVFRMIWLILSLRHTRT
jgi:hypothetical protein